MAWFKFEMWHGAGHQSKTVEYAWFGHDPSNHELESCFLRLAHEHELHNPSCRPEELDRLPDEVRDRLLRKLHNVRARAQREIDRLEMREKKESSR